MRTLLVEGVIMFGFVVLFGLMIGGAAIVALFVVAAVAVKLTAKLIFLPFRLLFLPLKLLMLPVILVAVLLKLALLVAIGSVIFAFLIPLFILAAIVLVPFALVHALA